MIRGRQIGQWGLLAIVAIMPFHAFLSVGLGHLFGHQALWQSWKEVVLLVVAMAALFYAWKQMDGADATQHQLARWRRPLTLSIAGFAAICLLVTLMARPPLTAAIFGLKTDLEFLLAFGLAYGLAQRGFKAVVFKAVVLGAGVVIAFGLLQIYALPKDFLAHFGYGPTTIQPFLPLDPVLPNYRILSTLGGPNQLGSYLILPLCLMLALLIRRFRWWQPLFLFAGLVVMWHSYSRSAWLGLSLAMVVTVIAVLPRSYRVWAAGGTAVALALASVVLFTSAGSSGNLQYYVFHGSVRDTGYQTSTVLHGLAIQHGLDDIKQHPLGQGLGTAGPASFHGAHPNIPESFYLQIGIEAGVLGLIGFLLIHVFLAVDLMRLDARVAAPALMGALAGISLINLFLHGWADSSTALIYWTAAGAALGTKT